MAVSVYNPYYRSALATVPYFAKKVASATRRGAVYATGGSKTMVTTHKRRKTGRRMSLRELVKRTESAKHFSFENNGALTHNTIFTCVPTQGITQGTSNIGRIGDSVYLCALKISGNMQAHTTAGAYSYRILVGWSGEEVTTVGASSSLVSGLGGTEIFLPGTFTSWTPNGIVNPKAFTVLYDQTVDINSLVTATSDLSSFAFTVPLNQNFNYQASGSIQGKSRNLCVIVIGSVAFGVTGVTNAGTCVWTADLVFKE